MHPGRLTGLADADWIAQFLSSPQGKLNLNQHAHWAWATQALHVLHQVPHLGKLSQRFRTINGEREDTLPEGSTVHALETGVDRGVSAGAGTASAEVQPLVLSDEPRSSELCPKVSFAGWGASTPPGTFQVGCCESK